MISQETNVVRVNLNSILFSETNEMFRKKKDNTLGSLQDLISSIKQVGVIQSILLRPDKENPDKFRLISGERRVRASIMAGLVSIPAMIQEVDDKQALNLQMIENIQRENPHFIYEADGYQKMMENDEGLTTANLALQMGKSETYIIQRLKLNDLIPEAKKAGLENRLSIGHCLILAKLTKENQKEAIKDLCQSNGFGSVNDLQDYVNRSIINDLSEAPFNLEDAELVPKAGSCMACPKRSGASPLLFSDIKEKDRCIDSGCFANKCSTFLYQKTKEVIESQPEVAFFSNGNNVTEDISALLTAHNIKPLQEFTDFNTWDKSGTKIKGLWLTGSKAGHFDTIHVKKSSASKANVEVEVNTKELVTKIQERVKRGKELDDEKVYGKILESFKNHGTQKKGYSKKMNADEEIFLWFMVLDKAGYGSKQELYKSTGVKKITPESLYNCLKNLKPEQKAFMLRKVMLNQYGGNYPRSEYGFIIRKIAEHYSDIQIETFEKEQNEIRTKRDDRAKQRIKDLQSKK